MAKTIPQELKTFKTTVSPSMSSMNQVCTTLEEKSREAITATEEAKQGIDSYYNSSNKETILNKFVRINTVYTKINSSINSDLKKMLTESQTIIDNVTKLEGIIKDIETKEQRIKSEYNKEQPSYSTISDCRTAISQKETEFDRISNETTTKLNQLKTMDESLTFVSDFTAVDISSLAGDLRYGSFQEKVFTASDGRQIKYFLYVPDYGREVTGLPVMLYMHGGSSKGTSEKSWRISGLTAGIMNQKITPGGIVIMPYIQNFEGDNIEPVLKELTDSVVQEYNADTNKISISGHSYGGIETYRMVNKYPDYFSAAIPISGTSTVTDAFKNIKVWSFNGRGEGGNSGTSRKVAEKTIDSINNAGGDAYISVVDKDHAGTSRDTYLYAYTSPDGE
jgi:predicted peptidase